MRDLAQYYPALESVSIVPAELTAYRENLYPLEPFTRKECAKIIDQVTSFADECLKKLGTRLFFCADELYIKAGRPIPAYPYWEEFTQIENGVGMMASMAHELEMALDYISTDERQMKRSLSIATGGAAYAYICGLVGKIQQICPMIECDVYCVKNNFFGGQVTVSGLITGRDLAEQLKDCILGDELLLPRTMLRSEGDLFLCDMTPKELSEKLGVPIRFVSNDGADFLDAVLGCGGELLSE
jgi:NifB/MoaA-like Fe-S oxidoreductase